MDRTKYLDEKEAKQLMRYARSMASKSAYYYRAWMVIDILLSTGIRASEARKIRLKDLDLDKSSIIKIFGKGKRWRNVEISNNLKKHLIRFLKWKQKNGESLDPDSYLIINRLGRYYTLAGIQNLFKKIAKEAGLNPVYSIHSTRHCFGYMVYGKTKNIRLCQELLGHKSLSSTVIYSHVDPNLKSKAINGLWR